MTMKYRLEDLTLDVAGSSGLDTVIGDSIVSAELELTIDGASNVTIVLEDPDQTVLQSEILTRWAWGKTGYGDEKAWIREGRPIDVKLDGSFFRLVKVDKTGTTLTLTLEDREVTHLRRHTKARKTTRAKSTRAQFIDTLRREVKVNGGIEFHCPELKKKQPIAKDKDKRSDADRERDAQPGISGGNLTVKGKDATPAQIRLMEQVLDVADSLNAPRLAVMGMVCANIGEAAYSRTVVNSIGAEGLFQIIPATEASTGLDPLNVAECAHWFLTRGFYRHGGAIKIAKENPTLSPGTIASMVEGSDQGGSFYDEWQDEARNIIRAYGGGGGRYGSRVKRYEFTREKGESSWDAMGRLAEEVHWRRFMRRGTLWYISEDRLFRQKAALTITERDDAVDWIDFTLDLFARGKNPVAEVTVQARANRWRVLPGMVVRVEGQGVADGRWLVSTVRRTLTDPSGAVTVTLRKPVPALPEPNAGREALNPDDGVGSSSGVRGVYDLAKKFTGSYHYGGGHGPPLSTLTVKDNLDCSSSTSLALRKAGMFDGTVAIVSGQFAASWGKPGEGKYMTVWANDGHVWVELKIPGKRGKRFDTSGPGESGPRLRFTERSTAGFTPRHWPGT